MLQPALYRIGYTGVSFVIGLLLANVLAPAFFGKLSLLMVNASILSLVTGFGADSIVLHLLVNNKWNFKQSHLFIWIVLGIQVLLLLLVQFIHIQYMGTTALSQVQPIYLLYEILYFLGLVVTEKYLVLYYSFQRARLVNQLLLVITLLYGAIIVLFQYRYQLDYFTVLKIIGFTGLLQIIATILVYHLSIKPLHFEWLQWIDIKNAFQKSIVIMITNVVQLLAYRIDFWILSEYHSNYEVGVFAQANKMANLIWIVPNIIALLAVPKFTKINSDGFLSFFKMAFVSNVLLTILTLLATLVFYCYFLSAAYYPGLHAFFIMLPGYFCWATVIYFGAYFSWLGKFNYNLYASASCLIFILLFDFVLIPAYSINGAAISNTIVYSAVLLLYLVFFSREKGYAFSRFFRFNKTDLRFVQKLFK